MAEITREQNEGFYGAAAAVDIRDEDFASGTDSTFGINVNSSDTAVATESQSIGVFSSDVLNYAENQSLVVGMFSSDLGTSTDSDGSSVTALSSSDANSEVLEEALAQVWMVEPERGELEDIIEPPETAVGIDEQDLYVNYNQTETINYVETYIFDREEWDFITLLSENATMSAVVSDPDFLEYFEHEALEVTLVQTDSVSATEAQAVVANFFSSELVTTIERAVVTTALSSIDQFNITETATVGISSTDVGSTVENQAINVTLADVDYISVFESAIVGIRGSEGLGEFDFYRRRVMLMEPSSYWRLGELNGSIAIDELERYEGVYGGGVTIGHPGGVVGQDTSALFDGTGFVQLDPLSYQVATKVNFNWWFYATGNSGFFHNTEDYSAWLEDGILNVAIFGTEGTIAARHQVEVSESEWHQINWFADSGISRLHVDGRLVDEQAVGLGINHSNNIMYLGRGGLNGEFYMQGYLEEIAVFERALSDMEVALLYYDGSSYNDYSEMILNDRPVGYWHLAGEDALSDMSLNGYDLTVVGGPLEAPSILYQANEQLSAEVSAAYTSAFKTTGFVSLDTMKGVTLETWIMPTGAPDASARIIGMHETAAPGIILRYDTTGTKLNLYDPSNSYVSEFPLVIGNIYHLVLVFTAGLKQLYINGELVVHQPISTGNKQTGANSVDIGGRGTGSMTGLISEPAIYDYALSASQILLHYNVGQYGKNIARIVESATAPKIQDKNVNIDMLTWENAEV